MVTTRPIVVGNDPGRNRAPLYEKVALLGQVPVKVRGPVAAGDLLVASGLEDGTAAAVAPEGMTFEQAQLVVGRSLEDSPGTEGATTVNALVGLPEVATAGAWGASRREIRLHRWLLGVMLLAWVGVAVGRWRLA